MIGRRWGPVVRLVVMVVLGLVVLVVPVVDVGVAEHQIFADLKKGGVSEGCYTQKGGCSKAKAYNLARKVGLLQTCKRMDCV